MSEADKIQAVETNLLDLYPSKKHHETGQDLGRMQLKHKEIDIKKHLGRLHVPKTFARNDEPNVKQKEPKQRDFK